jgi:uncharacterized protein
MEFVRDIARSIKSLSSSSLQRLEDPLIREKLINKIHCFEDEQTGIVFCKDSVTAVSCPKSLKNALTAFLAGASRSSVCRENGLNANHFQDFILFLFNKLGSKTVERSNNQGNFLDRLVLNISSGCNLSCKYCYAGGGSYGAAQGLMNEQVAFQTLDTFYAIFDSIDKLQFFGGEPLLNPGLICSVGDEINKRYSDGRISKMPRFSIVTNGTFSTDEIIDLLDKYCITPTISLDGPARVNDYLRGDQTFNRVCEFTNRLEQRGIDFSFESTYTAHHLELGITLADLLDFFHVRFQKKEVHIPAVMLDPRSRLALTSEIRTKVYRDAVEYSMGAMKSGSSACLSFASRMLQVYLDRRPIPYYCPAGLGTFSVDATGNVYPCFMLTGVREFWLGNIFDDPFPQEEAKRKIEYLMSLTDKAQNKECLGCWASPFCSGCIGRDYIQSGLNFEKNSCEVAKGMAEGYLIKAIMIVDDG